MSGAEDVEVPAGIASAAVGVVPFLAVAGPLVAIAGGLLWYAVSPVRPDTATTADGHAATMD